MPSGLIQIVLIPKATGTFMVANALHEQIDDVFDLTVGYGGIAKELIPYEEYLVPFPTNSLV